MADSVRGILLQFARRDYLRSLGTGLSFMLNGILAMVLAVVAFAISFAFAVRGYGDLPTIWMLSVLVGIVVWLAISAGFWMSTPLDPGAVCLKELNPPRKTVRVCIVLQACVVAFNVSQAFILAIPRPLSLTQVSQAFDFSSGAITAYLLSCGILAFTVQVFVGLHYLRVLARRVPDAFIVKRVGLYMWLLPVLYITAYFTFGLGPVIAVVAYWTIHDRLRKHIKSILKFGTPAMLPKMSVGG